MNFPATEHLIKMIDEFPKMKRFFIDDPRHQEFAVALVLACKDAGPELRVLVMNRQEKSQVQIVLPPPASDVPVHHFTKDELGKLFVPEAPTPMPTPFPIEPAPLAPAVATVRTAASKRGKR